MPEGLEEAAGEDEAEEGNDGGETARKNELIFLAGRVYCTKGVDPEPNEDGSLPKQAENVWVYERWNKALQVSKFPDIV